MNIYLAGPDVFRPDAQQWADSARTLCRRYGFEPLLALDHPETTAEGIFEANLDLIRRADVVAANLDPFRGAEPDSGTAFEVGFALALGKRVCGYVSQPQTSLSRVAAAGYRAADATRDVDGYAIEDFGLACNLMLAVPCRVVAGGLESCLSALRGA